MKLRDFGLFTDQNIDAEVAAEFRSHGFDVVDVKENGWHGRADDDLLVQATAEGRVVVTHDADYGELAVVYGADVVGILYFRPGHLPVPDTLATVRAVLAADPDVTPPFLVVGKWTAGGISVRVRGLAAGP